MKKFILFLTVSLLFINPCCATSFIKNTLGNPEYRVCNEGESYTLLDENNKILFKINKYDEGAIVTNDFGENYNTSYIPGVLKIYRENNERDVVYYVKISEGRLDTSTYIWITDKKSNTVFYGCDNKGVILPYNSSNDTKSYQIRDNKTGKTYYGTKSGFITTIRDESGKTVQTIREY